MEDVKWLLRRHKLQIFLLFVLVIAGMLCLGKRSAEKQMVAEEVWEPPVDMGSNETESDEAETEEMSAKSAYWFVPQADDALFTEEEKEQLQSMVLSAAESVGGIYKDIVIADAPSYSSGVEGFTGEQGKAVVEHLSREGYVSIAEDAAMQNQELICKGWFLPPNTYDCGSFVVNGKQL